jgi:hypothetical protein
MTDDITALFARIRIEAAQRPARKRRRRVYPPADCRYMTLCRKVALQESHALRGFARQQRLPKCRPLDVWAEWVRESRPGRAAANYGKAAA